jgi:oxygen-dependent protoporphyrinogen oxidase
MNAETRVGAETLVVGAGLSGLAYAHGRGPAADLLVLESAPSAGGLVQTRTAPLPGTGGTLRFELGPEALQDNAPETLALLDELRLRARPASAAASRRWILLDGRLREVPADPLALLTSGLLSTRGKLRALSEPLRERDVALDGSIADFVRHRLGEEVLERLVDPFVTGVFAGDPEELSLRAAFPQAHELVSRHGSLLKGFKARAAEKRAAGEKPRPPSLMSVEGGLGALAGALAGALGGRLRLGVRVASIARDGEGWRVEAQADGDGAGAPRQVRARRLVVATPAAAAGRLLLAAVPALGEALTEIRSESVISLSHAWRRPDVRHPLDGFGYLVPSGEKRLHLGTLFSSSIAPECCPPGLVLLRTLLGGARHGRLLDWPDEELLGILREDVAPILGLSGEPAFSSVTRWRHALPRYDLRQPERQERVDALLQATPGLSLLGSWRRGISCNSLIEAARRLAREHGAPAQAPRNSTTSR